MPFGSGPKTSDLVPSLAVLTADTSCHVPTRSPADCAIATLIGDMNADDVPVTIASHNALFIFMRFSPVEVDASQSCGAGPKHAAPHTGRVHSDYVQGNVGHNYRA
jgi:hypothetical protein